MTRLSRLHSISSAVDLVGSGANKQREEEDFKCAKALNDSGSVQDADFERL